MPASQGFFRGIDSRFSASQKERSRQATALFNHLVEPKVKLDEKNAYWSEPLNTKRANFRPFENYQAFAEDVNALIMKPYIYSVLAAYELQKMFLIGLAALGQVVKLSPGGFFNKALDFAEACIGALAFELLSWVELGLQVGSLAMRLGVTAFSALGGAPWQGNTPPAGNEPAAAEGPNPF